MENFEIVRNIQGSGRPSSCAIKTKVKISIPEYKVAINRRAVIFDESRIRILRYPENGFATLTPSVAPTRKGWRGGLTLRF